MFRKLARISMFVLAFSLFAGGVSFASHEIDIVQELGVSLKASTLSSLSGEEYFYRLLRISNLEQIDRWADEIKGSLTFKPDGTITGSGHFFESDGTSGDATLSGSYTVSNGSMALTLTPSISPTPPPMHLAGWVSGDGKVAVLTQGESDPDGIHLGIVFAVKKDLGKQFQTSDLSGTYHFRALGVEDVEGSSTGASVCSAELVCDGNGHYTFTSRCFHSDGKVDTGTGSGTYTVASDGTVSFTEQGASEAALSGNLSSDTGVLVISMGTTNQGIEQMVGIALKEDSGKTFTEGDVSGTYHLSSLGLDNMEETDRSGDTLSGTMSFDAVHGQWSGSVDFFESDTSSDSGIPVNGTYSVASDGSVSFIVKPTDSPNERWTGRVSTDGNIIILTRGEKEGAGFLTGLPLLLLGN